MARALNPPFSGWRHLTHIHTPAMLLLLIHKLHYQPDGSLKTWLFFQPNWRLIQMSLICIISFWNRRWWSKVGKTIFHIGVWTELLGPFKTDHSSAGEYGKNQERRRRGDVILKPRSDKKENCTHLRISSWDRPHPAAPQKYQLGCGDLNSSIW